MHKHFQKVEARKMVEKASDLYSPQRNGINITRLIAFVRNPESN